MRTLVPEEIFAIAVISFLVLLYAKCTKETAVASVKLYFQPIVSVSKFFANLGFIGFSCMFAIILFVGGLIYYGYDKVVKILVPLR